MTPVDDFSEELAALNSWLEDDPSPVVAAIAGPHKHYFVSQCVVCHQPRPPNEPLFPPAARRVVVACHRWLDGLSGPAAILLVVGAYIALIVTLIFTTPFLVAISPFNDWGNQIALLVLVVASLKGLAELERMR